MESCLVCGKPEVAHSLEELTTCADELSDGLTQLVFPGVTDEERRPVSWWSR